MTWSSSARGVLARLRRVWLRLIATLRGGSDADAGVAEELRFHIEQATARNVARGMSPAAARREALLRFGGVDRTLEAARDVGRARWLEEGWRDIRQGLRQLRRSPGFGAAAILTLALGIGANTAIFSVLEAVLLRPLPYGDPGALVSFSPNGYAAYMAWTEDLATLESTGAYTYSVATVDGGAEPVRVWTLAATSSLLPTLAVAPARGRGLSAADDVSGSAPVVMLRHAFWVAQFGADPGVVGSLINVNGQPHEVIGVLPASLEFPPPARAGDGSMPRTADIWTGVGWLSDLYERGGFYAVGRLAPGASTQAAMTELNAVANATLGPGDEPVRVQVRRVTESVIAPLRPAVLAFTVGVGLVLLIACANLGSLMLARLSGRRRELALRVSLGAAPGRIVRQVITESGVLAFLGALTGLAVAWSGLRALLALAPPELARVHGASLSPTVLAYSLGLALLTTVLIGALPALRARSRAPQDALGSTRGTTSDRASGRIHGLLVAAEVALAVVLLVGAGLLLRSFSTLAAVTPGFQSEGLVTADVLLPPDRYPTRESVLLFFEQLESRLGARTGVASVSAIDRLPYGPSLSRVRVQVVGAPPPSGPNPPLAVNTSARPGYFETMGIPVLEGREFEAGDRVDGLPVIVVGRALADRQWPDRSALGERLEVFGVEREIVGVVGDVRHLGPTTPVDPIIYLPQSQDAATRRNMSVVVRAAGAVEPVVDALRSEIRAIDATLPVSNLRTFGALRAQRTAGERFNTLVVAAFAALAALLAAVGIYGVMSFTVAQRRREIGVRMALGASRSAVLAAFLSQAARAAAAGTLAGIAVAIPLARLARSMLFGIGPTDIATYVGVVLFVAALALLAAALPARRAATTQPASVLGAE